MIEYKLKGLLSKRNMTQKELATKTGIRPATISGICNGWVRELRISVIEKLCTTLDCQPNDIIMHKPDND